MFLIVTTEELMQASGDNTWDKSADRESERAKRAEQHGYPNVAEHLTHVAASHRANRPKLVGVHSDGRRNPN